MYLVQNCLRLAIAMKRLFEQSFRRKLVRSVWSDSLHQTLDHWFWRYIPAYNIKEIFLRMYSSKKDHSWMHLVMRMRSTFSDPPPSRHLVFVTGFTMAEKNGFPGTQGWVILHARSMVDPWPFLQANVDAKHICNALRLNYSLHLVCRIRSGGCLIGNKWLGK